MGMGPSIMAVQIGGSAGLEAADLQPRRRRTHDLLSGRTTASTSPKPSRAWWPTVKAARSPSAPPYRFGEIYTIVDNDDNPANGLNTNSPSEHGGAALSAWRRPVLRQHQHRRRKSHFNPERIQIDDDSGILAGFATPQVSVGAQAERRQRRHELRLRQATKSWPTQAYTVASHRARSRPRATNAGRHGSSRLTIANYNIENLDPSRRCRQVQRALAAADRHQPQGAWTSCRLQEVQDNNGRGHDTVTSASTTLQMLVDAINTASGGTAQYAFQDNPFIGDDQNGGEPGGNIRNAYPLPRRPRRRPGRGVAAHRRRQRRSHHRRPAAMPRPTNPFYGPAWPPVADFTFNGQTITVIDNHFSSKGGQRCA